jgi:hypothetical protein
VRSTFKFGDPVSLSFSREFGFPGDRISYKIHVIVVAMGKCCFIKNTITAVYMVVCVLDYKNI